MKDKTIQILLVEDSAVEAVLLKKALATSPFGPFDIVHVERLAEAVDQLKAQHFDTVLLDLGVAHSQGIGALEEICKDKPDDVSVVVLTGQDDQAMAVRALQRGAEDYLVKGGTPDNTAGRAVRYAIERKRAAEAMLASEKRLALAVDAAQMGIVDWNLQTGKITGSRHHARLFGQVFENGDCFADEYERCIHPDDRESVRNAIQHSLATREEYHQEFRVIWPGGSEHWIESRGRVFDDEHGRPLQLLGTVVDISQRKAAELAARIREGELAHLSRITTVGQMASGLAHELNQPLAAILNYASVCMDHLESRTGSPSTAQTAIGEVMNETRRAGAIINRMRFFVRKQEPQSAPLDINERVRESVRMMGFELRHQRIRPRLELSDNLPQVSGDAVQIEQVLVNLLFNAIEAMQESDVSERQLTVQTAPAEKDGFVQVRIIDSGTGISPANMERLFEPFFTTKSKGLGMGLNICRSIIESQGGRLTAARNPDRGMRFCFTVPVIGGGTA